ncbi:ribonuclease BN (tRNA processing enzyme) [Novosphingobium sp. PhB165]|uniref:MBL fold metallo-hydrolase n=1 Tax=Novosphingobium sp. PhB165 TaxID=2485105 RepID=UPI0010E101F8|nr:MBL fold metallo-hydrolase [Novosphingobium sp. PhB165]TCM14042.1 ribonuclease BN (tRNA processing enzyme) [Novosphingobium sp. PhB165]
MGGPIAAPDRSQPANLLVRGQDAYLVDCGDGTVERLARTRIRLQQVRAILLSHLHFDHTAGLAGVLGLRSQTNVDDKLTIYGPPGTKQLVSGLLASMRPAVEAGYGLPGAPVANPTDAVEVIELVDGASFKLGDIAVTARQNTHYSFAVGSDADRRFKSLAFRFEAPGRTIAYTGDTGPSPAVEQLAQGADLLVSEMIDVQRTLDNVRRNTPNAAGDALSGIGDHLARHHLTPEQVGQLAAHAGVKSLVVTHLVAPMATAGDQLGYLARIGAAYNGPAVIAQDLDEF